MARGKSRLGKLAQGAGKALRRWPVRVLLAVVVLLVAARIAAPYVVLHYVNDRLAHMDGYTGHVDDVSLAIWRGAYQLDRLRIEKLRGHVPVPFVDAPHIDISVEWPALLRGAVVAKVFLDRPVINFVGGGAHQTGGGNDWRAVVDDLVPITINLLTVRDGAVHYRDYSKRPAIDVSVSRLAVVAHNLSTIRGREEALPASLEAHGTAQHSGALAVHARLDPFAERPTFVLDLALEHLAAPELNPLLRAYAGVDAERGRFFLYSELRSRDGHFEGYVKPMVEGLSVFHFGEQGDFLHQVRDAIVQIVEDLFENHGTDRFATRIPVSGTFAQVQVNGWAAFLGILYNTFIEAIRHGVEHGTGWQLEPRAAARAGHR